MRYACPKCKSDDLRVECTVIAELVQQEDGHCFPRLEDLEGVYFDHESIALCVECEHQSELVDFEVPEHAPTPR